MLHPEHYCSQRRVRGQSDWLSFLCKTLSFSISSRFIPALSHSPDQQPRSKNISGSLIRLARMEFKPPLTQDQLAGKLAADGIQLDRVAITKIETGNRCLMDFELRGIARALKTDVNWLLGMSGAADRVPANQTSKKSK